MHGFYKYRAFVILKIYKCFDIKIVNITKILQKHYNIVKNAKKVKKNDMICYNINNYDYKCNVRNIIIYLKW